MNTSEAWQLLGRDDDGDGWEFWVDEQGHIWTRLEGSGHRGGMTHRNSPLGLALRSRARIQSALEEAQRERDKLVALGVTEVAQALKGYGLIPSGFNELMTLATQGHADLQRQLADYRDGAAHEAALADEWQAKNRDLQRQLEEARTALRVAAGALVIAEAVYAGQQHREGRKPREYEADDIFKKIHEPRLRAEALHVVR